MTQPTRQTVQSSNQILSDALMVKRLVAGTLLINFFVFALVAWSTYPSRVQYQEQANITTLNLSRVLEESIHGDIDKIDIVATITRIYDYPG